MSSTWTEPNSRVIQPPRKLRGTQLAELGFMWRQARPVWRLVPLNDKLELGVAALMMALAGASGTAVPLLIGAFVDRAQRAAETSQDASGFLRLGASYLGLIGGAFLLREAMNVGRRYLVESTSARMARRMTVDLLDHLLKVELGVLGRFKVGALDSRMSRSVEGVIRFLRLGFLDFLPALVTGSFALAAAVFRYHALGAVMVGVVPVAVWLTTRQLMSQKDVRLRLMRLGEEVDGMVVEQLGGVEHIRAAHTERFEVKRLDRTATQLSSLHVRHHFEMSLFGCGKALNEGSFHIVVVACAAYFAMRHTIGFGDILSLSMLFANVMAPLNEVHRVLDEGHESSLRVNDLMDLLRLPVDASYGVRLTTRPRLEVGRPAIAVRNLEVEHASLRGPAVRALREVSFDIRHGESIGIAGRSGAGKSTCVKALLGLVHPRAGDVALGGVPLHAIPRAEIARLVGYVGQRPFVVAGTIAENIAYGKDVDLVEIERVARMANLHDEIVRMPRGYETQISERGRNLSGGQCQRLALARTLLHDPPILILDEATSALDNIGERYVQDQLERKRADRTIVLVAHRLSTLRYADRILVFDAGAVVETGTFCDLVEAGGVFADLVRSAGE